MLQAVIGEHPYGPRPRSPGTLGIIEQLRWCGMKIGATTGYLPEMMEINRKHTEHRGHQPDSTVCASDVPAGRPYPS